MADAASAFQVALSNGMTQPVFNMQVTINVCVFVFDLLYVDGESLVHLPLRARRDRMSTSLSMRPGYLQAAQALEFPPHLTPSGAPAIESTPIKVPSASPAGDIAVPQPATNEEHNTAATAPSPTSVRRKGGPARDLAPKPDEEDMRSEPHTAAADDEDMRSGEPRQADGTDEEMRSDGGDVSGGEADPRDESDGASDAGSKGDNEQQPEAKRAKLEDGDQPPAEGHPPVTAPDAQVRPCSHRTVRDSCCAHLPCIAEGMLRGF